MSQKRGPFPVVPILGVLVVFVVIYAIGWVSRDYVLGIVATILICGAFIVRWILQGRYS